jgi:hypothetical protein
MISGNVMMMSKRKRRHHKFDDALRTNLWIWRNWIKNGYRKASEINFEGNGVCTVLRLKSTRGEVFCCVGRSPYAIRIMKNAIVSLYKASAEEAPVFVPIKIFRLIESIEHG